jgi:predicted dehydrogenase
MKNLNKMRLAVVGGGINSAVGYAHYCAIKISNKFKIVTGCFSRDEEVNRKSSEIYGMDKERLYSTYQDIIEKEKENIDAIVLLTPTNIHHIQVMDAVKHNIPVICEKSLTSNIDEFLEIKSNYNEQFVSIVFNYICYPMIKELKQIIKIGKLGKIHNIKVEMPQEGFLRLYNGKPPTPQSWRLKDGSIPTISLDLGMHLYSLIKFLTGEYPIETISIQNRFGNFKSVVDDVTAIIRYSNDISCDMWYSKSALGHRNGMKIRIYGSKGSAEWVQTEPETLKMFDNSGNSTTVDRSSEICEISNQSQYNRFKVGHPAGYIESLANFYEDVFADLIQHKNKNFIDRNTFGMIEYEECIRLFESISSSSKRRCWVEIEL